MQEPLKLEQKNKCSFGMLGILKIVGCMFD